MDFARTTAALCFFENRFTLPERSASERWIYFQIKGLAYQFH